jgi:hypothetical protein
MLGRYLFMVYGISIKLCRCAVTPDTKNRRYERAIDDDSNPVGEELLCWW